MLPFLLNSRLRLIFVFVIVGGLLWGYNQFSSAQVDPLPPYEPPATLEPQLSWFYRPPDEESYPLLSEFDQFILTKTDEPVRDRLRESGVEAPILQYVAFDVIIDPGSCTEQPWHNQAADRPGDFCYISENHPDWFLLDRDGERMVRELAYGMKAVTMDPGHPGWRSFWLERVRENQEELGWDGVFLDNVEASLAKRKRRDALPHAYRSDVSYQAAVEGFLAYIYSAYFQPEARPLLANIIEVHKPDVWYRYLRYLDGAMIEGWSVGWENDYFSPTTWEEHIRLAEHTQAQGKQIILIAQGEEADAQRQAFTYASYLLVNEGNASFRYTNANTYHEPWLYENYSYHLGPPLGRAYQDGHTWFREFKYGTVQVNPATHTATIDVKAVKQSDDK